MRGYDYSPLHITRSGSTTLPLCHFPCRMCTLTPTTHPYCMMYPLESHDQASQHHSWDDPPSQALESQDACCQPKLFGTVWPSKLGSGPRLASPVNKPRSISIPKHPLTAMNHHKPISGISTMTLLAPYHFHKIVHTY